MGYTEIEFPCGLKIKSKSFLFYFGDADWDKLKDDGCPIHGKMCKQ